jgi:hypothetical protein
VFCGTCTPAFGHITTAAAAAACTKPAAYTLQQLAPQQQQQASYINISRSWHDAVSFSFQPFFCDCLAVVLRL